GFLVFGGAGGRHCKGQAERDARDQSFHLVFLGESVVVRTTGASRARGRSGRLRSRRGENEG
ncbi:hypothetical protein ABTD06_18930, partial [Acinetobacter baumannii]